MKTSIPITFTLMLLLLGGTLVGAADEDAADTPSPVGIWRLDREAIETGLDESAHELLKSLLIPDMELRITVDGRFEGVVDLSGLGGEGGTSEGTWVQSREVLSFAALGDDAQPISLVARLRGERLVLELGSLTLPFRCIERPPAPEPEVEEAPRIGLGGPGPSISIPRIERDDGRWPVDAITARNHRRVA